MGLDEKYTHGISIAEATELVSAHHRISLYVVAHGYEGLITLDPKDKSISIDCNQLNMIEFPKELNKGESDHLEAVEITLKQVQRVVDLYEDKELVLAYLDVMLSQELSPVLQFNLRCTKANLLRLQEKHNLADIEFKLVEEKLLHQLNETQVVSLATKRIESRKTTLVPRSAKEVTAWDVGTLYYYMGYNSYVAAKH
ncbi:MAG: hypothetical protein ACXAD7_28810, partial [Candidatus Kariarchaeaceae archaeon]